MIIRDFVKHMFYLLQRLLMQITRNKEPKIFCIGRNKTGTTSIKVLFRSLGFPVAPQRPAELLFDDWINNDFNRIIKFVKYGGVVFQDIPFSLPDTYRVLDKAYPKSKFILTVRDSPDIWYQSLISFHSKVFNNGEIPDKQTLQKCKYIHKGWMWKMFSHVYSTPENDIYNEHLIKESYCKHNEDVIKYFKESPEKLLILNLKDKNAAIKLTNFLKLSKPITKLPWENKT